jgi:hypothetical protein
MQWCGERQLVSSPVDSVGYSMIFGGLWYGTWSTWAYPNGNEGHEREDRLGVQQVSQGQLYRWARSGPEAEEHMCGHNGVLRFRSQLSDELQAHTWRRFAGVRRCQAVNL